MSIPADTPIPDPWSPTRKLSASAGKFKELLNKSNRINLLQFIANLIKVFILPSSSLVSSQAAGGWWLRWSSVR